MLIYGDFLEIFKIKFVLVTGRGILRPCDQYPSEPGVLNSRPVSALSGDFKFELNNRHMNANTLIFYS